MKGTLIDLTGQRFGRLVAIRYEMSKWTVVCDCGATKAVASGSLRNGETRSCGCLNREVLSCRSRTHGMSKTREWAAYSAAKNRCQNPNADRFPEYGARGIEFRFQDFDSFWAELGPRPSPKHSVDRIDVEGHYEPGNVRWATQKEQCLNRRRARILEFQGRKQNLGTWSEELGIGHNTILARLKRGWSVERALSTPARPATRR
jgi:hypothetical protein